MPRITQGKLRRKLLSRQKSVYENFKRFPFKISCLHYNAHHSRYNIQIKTVYCTWGCDVNHKLIESIDEWELMMSFDSFNLLLYWHLFLISDSMYHHKLNHKDTKWMETSNKLFFSNFPLLMKSMKLIRRIVVMYIDVIEIVSGKEFINT